MSCLELVIDYDKVKNQLNLDSIQQREDLPKEYHLSTLNYREIYGFIADKYKKYTNSSIVVKFSMVHTLNKGVYFSLIHRDIDTACDFKTDKPVYIITDSGYELLTEETFNGKLMPNQHIWRPLKEIFYVQEDNTRIEYKGYMLTNDRRKQISQLGEWILTSDNTLTLKMV